MSATETAIRPHDLLSIEPIAVIAHTRIVRAHTEEERRGREFVCFLVPSQTVDGKTYLVVVNTRFQQIYCHCERARYGGKCAHCQSVVFHLHYLATYREYHACDLALLQEQERTYKAMANGTLLPIRGYRAQWAALGELIGELTRDAA